MTQKKLEIISPYTPEHEGPFCTRSREPVEMKFRDGRGNNPLGGYVGKSQNLTTWQRNGRYYPDDLPDTAYDLMNAREVPVAREFWVNEYTGVVPKNAVAHRDERDARSFENDPSYLRTIHVREVLPGEGA